MRNLAATRKIGRSWSPMISDQLWLLALIAGGTFVFAMITVFVVSIFTDIHISAWSIVGSIAPWYVAVMSGWIVYIQLPYFVANGRTRKAGFREWLNTGIAMAPVGAILMAIGFALELGIYNLAGFSTDVDESYGVNGAGDLGQVAYQFLLSFVVWFALGGFVGAFLYRNSDWGWLGIPIAISIASVTGSWNHTGGGFFAITRRIIPGINYESVWLDLGLSGVAIAVGVWLAWILIHDLPLRNP